MDQSIRKMSDDTGNGNPPPKDPPKTGAPERTVPKETEDDEKK